jgi:mannose-6-phosphate isomerase-like protein (cupin superfamily)
MNLKAQFASVTEYWSPKIVASVNDQYVKIAKLKGSFVWHDHELEDEMFYIVQGSLVIKYRDREVLLKEGDIHIVPKGTEHFPVAEEECWVMLIEPKSTKHTGAVVTKQTKSIKSQL